MELSDVRASKQKEFDLINELKEREFRKLRKEIKEFEKEVDLKKGEWESTKDQEQTLALLLEIKQLKELRLREDKNNDVALEKYKQELNDLKEDSFLLAN